MCIFYAGKGPGLPTASLEERSEYNINISQVEFRVAKLLLILASLSMTTLVLRKLSCTCHPFQVSGNIATNKGVERMEELEGRSGMMQYGFSSAGIILSIVSSLFWSRDYFESVVMVTS